MRFVPWGVVDMLVLQLFLRILNDLAGLARLLLIIMTCAQSLDTRVGFTSGLVMKALHAGRSHFGPGKEKDFERTLCVVWAIL